MLLVVSVFGSGGKYVLIVHTTMYLEYHTVVVLCYFFWFRREIVFGVTYVLSVQYSCAVVSVFLFGGKANLVLLTLFYSTLLALTHRQTDGQRNKYTRFTWAGGTCPRFAWAGGTFFPVVLLCQFLVLAGNRQFFVVVCLAGARLCLSFLSRSLYLY